VFSSYSWTDEGDVVPSSNPNSPGEVDLDELSCLLQETSAHRPIEECFDKSTAEQMSATDSAQGELGDHQYAHYCLPSHFRSFWSEIS